MGSRSGGGSRGASGAGGSTYSKLSSAQKQKVDAVIRSMGITDPQVKRDMMDALSKLELEYGIRQTDVKLIKMGYNELGYNLISNLTGKSHGIKLNSLFAGNYESVKSYALTDYTTGSGAITDNPIGHTLVHEQAHSIWNNRLNTGAKTELVSLFKSFKKDTTKSGYGRYSHKNTEEFFAEAVSKGVLGKKDKYTESVKGIVKKYSL